MTSRVRCRYVTVPAKWNKKDGHYYIEPLELSVNSWKPSSIKGEGKKRQVEFTLEPFNERFDYDPHTSSYRVLPGIQQNLIYFYK